jgi:hypothetical protein
MAKQETQAPAETEVAEISLDEFCSRLSETVKSPESIGGFHFTERAADRMRGTFEAYRARFDAFLNKPV